MNSNKDSPLRNAEQYIFPTQCNTLITKTQSIDIGYRFKTRCFFVHESLKRDHIKESDDRKKSILTRKN